MDTTFNPGKTLQAAAALLQSVPERRMTALRLVSLLYIADRESIQETGFPITGDDAVATDRGPVLTHTLAALVGRDRPSEEWALCIRPSDAGDVVLTGDPGVKKLSRYELRKLQEVSARFAAFDDDGLLQHTRSFPEWERNQPEAGSRRPISLRDILTAVCHSEHADAILKEVRAVAEFDQQVAGIRGK